MKLFSIIFLLLFFTEVNGQHEPRVFDLKEIKGQFKHFNLKTFDIDSLSKAERETDEIDRYYSKQENKRGLNEFAIYYSEEGEMVSGFRITYLIFDLKGKLVSSFELASKLEGNGFFSKSHGSFLNESEYILYLEYNDALGNPIIEKTIVKIKSNGEVELQTSYR